MKPTFRPYTAFISYSSRIDSNITQDVERFLEGIHANDLIPRGYRHRLEICRDTSDFPVLAYKRRAEGGARPESPLTDVIRALLGASQFLLVFVGPESRSHRWITQELDFWLQDRGPNNVVVCLTHGDSALSPEDLFPDDIVRYGLHEPLYIDLRGYSHRSRPDYSGRLFDEEVLRIAARLIGDVKPSDLIEGWRAAAAERAAQEVRARRRRTRNALSATAVLAGLSAFAIHQAYKRTTASRLVSQALSESSVPARLRLALKAYPDAPDQALPVIQSAVGRLAPRAWEHREATTATYWDVPSPKRPLPDLFFRPNGLAHARPGTTPKLLALETGAPLALPEQDRIPASIAGRQLSASLSHRFAAGLDGASVLVVDRATGRTMADYRLPPGSPPEQIAVADDGSSVAALLGNGQVWTPGARTPPCPFLPADAQDPERLLVAPHAGYVVGGYQTPCGTSTCRRVIALRPSDCRLVLDRRFEEGDVRALALAANVDAVTVLIGMRAELRAASLSSSGPEKSVPMAGDRALLLASPDGHFVATASQSGDISILALPDLTEAAVVAGYASNEAVTFSADGSLLAVAGYRDGWYQASLSRLDRAADFGRARWSGSTGGGPADWVLNGSRLAVAGPDEVVILDPATGKPETRLAMPRCLAGGGSIQDLFGQDPGGSISALSMPSAIVRWRAGVEPAECLPLDRASPRRRNALLRDSGSVVGIAGGRLIGTGPDAGRAPCQDHAASYRSKIAVSRNGRMLAWSDPAGREEEVGTLVSARVLSLYDCADATAEVSLPPRNGKDTRSVRHIAWDRDGHQLGMLVGEGETTHVIVWKERPCRDTRQCTRQWAPRLVVTTSTRYDEIALASGGRHLAVRGAGSIEVYDIVSETWLYEFGTRTADVIAADNTLTFSPDGALLAASFPANSPIIRIVDERRLIADACSRMPAELRPAEACGRASTQ